jgi:homoserine kinase
VVAARALLDDPDRLPEEDLLDLASALEGHPDNAAASLLGGLTLGWSDGHRWHAVRLDPHPDVEPVVCLPDTELSTARARAMLPDRVPHADAAFTAGRAALLVEAVTRRPQLLLPATEDRLHQNHREAAMPATLALVRALRDAGLAAVVSGAGPSVLVLTPGGASVSAVEDVAARRPQGWRVLRPGVETHGAVAVPLEDTPQDQIGDRGSCARGTVLQ